MKYYVEAPFLNMRNAPTDEAKVDSQAMCHEEVIVQKQQEKWALISTTDGYLGWVKKNGLVQRSSPYPTQIQTCRLQSYLYRHMDIEYGPIASLPFHTPLHPLEEVPPRWLKVALPSGQEAYIQKGDVETIASPLKKEELPQFSQKFLNLPYIWGGRTSFGYDCSGFVQMLYRQIGILLPRDAKDQIQSLRAIPMDALTPGDLLFFGKSEKEIGHVGLYLENGMFIHATTKENQPWIRISRCNQSEWSGALNCWYPYRAAASAAICSLSAPSC